jgi:hypothetical protein
MNCQIEFANDDVGRPCGKMPWLSVLTAELRSVLTVARNAAEILSASCAMTTTSLIHA